MSVRVNLNFSIKTVDSHASLLAFLSKNLPNVRQFSGCQSVKVLFDQCGQ